MFHGAEGNGSPYHTGLTACPAHRAARPAVMAKYSMFLTGLMLHAGKRGLKNQEFGNKRVWGTDSSLVYHLMHSQCSKTANETKTLLASTVLGKGVRKQSDGSSGFSMRSKSGQCFRTKAAWHPEVPSQIQAANLPAA